MKRLAHESGEPTGTVDESIAFDRKRASGTPSDKAGEHPEDPDAQVTKMKNGTTDMGHKAEHSVDLESGALLGVAANRK